MTRSNSISLLSIVMDVSTKKVPKTRGKMISAIMFLISRVLLCQLNDPFYFNILFLFPGFNTLFYFWGFLWFLLYFGVYFCFRVSFPSVLHLVSYLQYRCLEQTENGVELKDADADLVRRWGMSLMQRAGPVPATQKSFFS